MSDSRSAKRVKSSDSLLYQDLEILLLSVRAKIIALHLHAQLQIDISVKVRLRNFPAILQRKQQFLFSVGPKPSLTSLEAVLLWKNTGKSFCYQNDPRPPPLDPKSFILRSLQACNRRLWFKRTNTEPKFAFRTGKNNFTEPLRIKSSQKTSKQPVTRESSQLPLRSHERGLQSDTLCLAPRASESHDRKVLWCHHVNVQLSAVVTGNEHFHCLAS